MLYHQFHENRSAGSGENFLAFLWHFNMLAILSNMKKLSLPYPWMININHWSSCFRQKGLKSVVEQRTGQCQDMTLT